MLRLVADEDFNNDILRGLLRRQEALDLVRVQDVGLRQADDDTVLAWAAHNKRLVVTHDANTMTRAAYDRAVQGLPMPGLIVVVSTSSLHQAIEDPLLLAECSGDDEWAGQVVHVPLTSSP